MHFAKHQIMFSPGLLPTVAALVTLALTLHLANWQRARAAEKRISQVEFDQRVAASPVTLDADSRDAVALRFRRAEAIGEWFASGQIYLDNKTDGGTAGYHVITPLKLAGTNTFVLVNRGWIARGRNYPQPPQAEVPPATTQVLGAITLPTAKFIELSAHGIQASVWQNLTVDRYQKHFGLDVLPFVLMASEVKPAAKSELQMLSERPNAGVEKHVEYMLTWYSLSATIVIFWVALNFRVVRLKAPQFFKVGNAP